MADARGVADFYPSIDRARLDRIVAELLPPGLAGIVARLVRAPVVIDGEVRETSRGIPLGRALAPALSNAYLLGVDEAMHDLPVVYLRFGDDIALATPDERAREAAEATLVERLGTVGLALRDSKTRRVRYDGSPVVYLGHVVDATSVYERIGDKRLARIGLGPVKAAEPGEPAASETTVHASLRSRTLYVTERGAYLRVAAGLVVVERHGKDPLELPLRMIDRVLVLAPAAVSSGFVSECVSRAVPVLFFVGRGRAFGSLVAGSAPNPLRLRAQYDLVASQPRRLALARAIVAAKLTAMLRRLQNVAGAAEARGGIRAIDRALPAADSAESLRGYEGAATRLYYGGFAQRLKAPGFELHERTRRPPRDPINSLLSFAYSLLFGEMQTALLAHGLDPHPGLLHDLHRNHPALASDLIEPYRALIGDSFVLALVNNGQVDARGFEKKPSGAVYMNVETRRKVIAAYEDFMGRRAGGGKGATPRWLIDAAARAMLSVVLGEVAELDLPLTASIFDNEAEGAPAPGAVDSAEEDS